jgi:hypothetical protein
MADVERGRGAAPAVKKRKVEQRVEVKVETV